MNGAEWEQLENEWERVGPSNTTGKRMGSSGTKWDRVGPNGIDCDRSNQWETNGTEWEQLENEWDRVGSSGTEWDRVRPRNVLKIGPTLSGTDKALSVDQPNDPTNCGTSLVYAMSGTKWEQ